MQKINPRISIYIASLIFFLVSCTNTGDNAVSYNEKIVLSYEKVASLEDRLMFYILKNDSVNFDTCYIDFLNQIEVSKTEIKNLGAYNEYSEFQEAALQMLEMYKNKAADRLVELMNFMKGGKEEGMGSGINGDFFELKLFELDSIIEEEFERFENQQKKFAEMFGFVLM